MAGEDRISLLPDCLLLEIISRLELSTKEVIKTTTTISKRWQHLWTKLPTLVFIYKDDVTDLPYNTDLTDYCSFIDKTLTQCPTDVNYWVNNFCAVEVGRDEDDIEEEFLRGLLSSLGHVNEIVLGDANCLQMGIAILLSFNLNIKHAILLYRLLDTRVLSTKE
ncbi:ribonuclease H-like domain, reverse transcriptase, RNA-dependent DNA polymerase [Tanacetum coccineum]